MAEEAHEELHALSKDVCTRRSAEIVRTTPSSCLSTETEKQPLSSSSHILQVGDKLYSFYGTVWT